MKKSQILAALALAFALGVVAPVAGTYAEAGIAPMADLGDGTTTPTTATKAELEAVVNKISGQAEYKAFAELAAALAENTEKSPMALADIKSAITTALGKLSFGYNTQATLAQLVETAKGIDNYAAWSNLVEKTAVAQAVQAGTNKEVSQVTAQTNLLTAIQAFYPNAKLTDGETLQTTIGTATGLTLKDAEGNNTAYTYGNISLMVNTINAYPTSTNIYNRLSKALTAVAKDDAAKKTIADTDTIAGLVALANETDADAAVFNTTKAKNYKDLRDDIDTIDYDTLTATQMRTEINDLITAYETASGLKYADITNPAPEDPSQPINPTDPDTPTTPTTPDDGKGDATTTPDKNGAPNTGVVAEGADASAKSSVSIMAGVSSFITAAGSALVAIRRGKKA